MGQRGGGFQRQLERAVLGHNSWPGALSHIWAGKETCRQSIFRGQPVGVSRMGGRITCWPHLSLTKNWPHEAFMWPNTCSNQPGKGFFQPYVTDFFFFFLMASPEAYEILRPGIESQRHLRPMLQLWQQSGSFLSHCEG